MDSGKKYVVREREDATSVEIVIIELSQKLVSTYITLNKEGLNRESANGDRKKAVIRLLTEREQKLRVDREHVN